MPDQNGPTKVSIDMTEMGPGWLYFDAGQNPPARDELPLWLNRCLVEWLQSHPDARPRSTLGIVADGATVGIHLWFD